MLILRQAFSPITSAPTLRKPWKKFRLGQYIMIREGTAAKNSGGPDAAVPGALLQPLLYAGDG